MVNTSIKIVFGGGIFNSTFGFPTVEKVDEVLKVLEEEGVTVIDTAQVYGESEELLGQSSLASRFVIDTKYPGGIADVASTKENVIASGEESLKKLNRDAVDIYYLHAPDRQYPLEGILAGIDELYRSGKFKRFGLSNFYADEVEEVIRVAKQHNYVLPSVYQGNYSAIARRAETELFPTLHKYNIAFYAYSPIAGGFLTKTPEQLIRGGEGRWSSDHFIGQQYNKLYNKPAMLKSLDQWATIATELGVSKAELAYRWVAYNSHIQGDLGDAIIIGAKNTTQLKETLAALRNGPLGTEVANKIDEVWRTVEHESPLDNYNGFLDIPQKKE